MSSVRLVSVVVLVLASGRATAQPAPEPASPAPVITGPAIEERLAAIERRNEELRAALERQNAELREELELLKEDHEHVEERLTKLAPIASKLTGYFDMGFFSVAGDGSGIRNDIGHAQFPEYSGVPDSWVFMGDPLSTAINSRGDPATTGESRAVTFDAIRGRSSTFLVNNLNVGIFSPIGENTIFTAKFDVLPRGRDVSQPDGVFLGDYVDVRLAYLEHRIARKRVKLDLFVGKFDSVIGFEYRSQEAPTRIEVTPSLICRYTCGYPLGVKARARFLDESLVLNVAVTNGSHFSEGFGFYGETDTNDVKTVAGRLSYTLPFARELEIGVSGMFGAQDNQAKDDVYQWLYNIDLHYHRQDFVFRAEFLQGRARGQTEPGAALRCGVSPCLTFKGAYGLVGYRVTNVIMPYVRVDWRDALHESGASFVYISTLARGTFGVRLALTEMLTLKAEYTVNRELGRLPQFANDVFTSSLVVKY